jgi:hypothetical protein
MHTEFADFSIILKGVSHLIQFGDIANFLSIMHEDSYECIFDDAILRIFIPTQARHKGYNNYLYVIENGALKHNTVIQLSGVND